MVHRVDCEVQGVKHREGHLSTHRPIQLVQFNTLQISAAQKNNRANMSGI